MFNTDAKRSLRAFDKFTRPALMTSPKVKNILTTELQDSDLATTLDLQAGIDGLIVTNDGQIFNFASRVQFGKNYEAFSIRRSRPTGTTTEFSKLARAQKTGAAMPFVHIQSFIADDEQSAIVGIAPTRNLISYIGDHGDQWRENYSGETFYFVPWSELKGVCIFQVDACGAVEKKLGGCEMYNNFCGIFRDVVRVYPCNGCFCLEVGERSLDGKTNNVPFLGASKKFFFADEFAARGAVDAIADVLSVVDDFADICNKAIGEQLGEYVQSKISAACADVLTEARQTFSPDELPF